MVEVELDDPGLVPGASGDVPEGPDLGPAAAWLRTRVTRGAATAGRAWRAVRHHPVLVACVLVPTVALGVGGVTLQSAHERERAARWAHVGGTLLPLDGVPRAAWTLPAGEIGGLVAARGGRFVMADDGVLRGVDTDTGREAWHTDLVVEGERADLTGCEPQPWSAPADALAEPLACVLAVGEAVWLAVLDADDGALAVRALDGARSARVVAADDGDVVLLLDVGSGHELRREALADGTVRWSRAVDARVGASSYRVQAGAVELGADEGLAVELATGRTLEWWPRPVGSAWTAVTSLAGGARAVWSERVRAVTAGGVRSASGELLFELEDAPLVPFPDDGSAGDVVVTRDPRALHGLDAATGRRLWTSDDVCGLGPGVRLRGSLVCADDASGTTVLVRIDLATGLPVWRTVLPELDGSRLVTDGEVVVAWRSADPDGDATRAQMWAVRWDDGDRVWSGWPAGLDSQAQLVVVDRRLYGVDGADVVRLR